MPASIGPPNAVNAAIIPPLLNVACNDINAIRIKPTACCIFANAINAGPNAMAMPPAITMNFCASGESDLK